MCYSKLFWTIVSASFAFTFFTYGVVYNQIQEVKADNNQDIERVLNKIDTAAEKIEDIKSDVSFIRGQLDPHPNISTPYP